MVKTKKSNFHAPLVITGYITFVLLAISVFISTTLPFGKMLLDPRVLYGNVAISLIALSVGAVLPLILGYVLGNKAIRSRSNWAHHFNGVLFGLLAFWIMNSLIVGIIIPQEFLADQQNVRIILFNVIPSVVVAVLAAGLVIAHSKSKQATRDIIEYKPFFIALAVCMVLPSLCYLVMDIAFQQVAWYSFMALGLILVIGAISYAALRHTNLKTFQKLSWSVVSVSVAFVLSFVISQFVYAVSYQIPVDSTMEMQTILGIVSSGLALAGWIVYWRLQVERLK